MAAEVEEKAPDFTLPSDSWEDKVSLESARREGPVVLFFYPGDWASVSVDQMSRLQEEIGRFEEKVMAVSVDAPWSHKRSPKIGVSTSPALGPPAQGHPRVRRQTQGGFPKRAYFVIDREARCGRRGSRRAPGTSRR